MKSIAVLVIVLMTSICSGRVVEQASSDAPWQITITSKEEPGEPLIVSGSVYGPDGVMPLKGASVYVYQTDITGYYTPGGRDSSNPRLKGTMRTDDKGRYEFRTIKPGPYPSARIPAHIHYVVSADGYKQRVFEIVFEGDPNITDRIRSDAANEESGYSIRKLERDKDNLLRCVQDIKLKRN
ncbi:MAG TPA: protocatechuate 3,4-dioxygenase [Blastocatellia bacterium]|nr:protocatechuate 3,4-dioxygenase [Blastocatellia bacterium]